MKEIKDIIPAYIDLVEKEKENSERYKWLAINHFQESWDNNCPVQEFHEMFKKAFAKRENLIFQNSFGFLNSLAKVMPEKAKNLFGFLFNDEISIEDRIPKYQEMAVNLLPELKLKLGKKNINHQQDERTISFLLTLHNPEIYYLYKDNVYKWLCELKEEKPKDAGQKYFHFCQLAEHELASIRLNSRIQQLIIEIVPNNFPFDSTKIILQDILYRTMPKTKETRKEFFILLTDEVKSYIEAKGHPLSEQQWCEQNTAYQWISIWKTLDIDPYFLHYEIIHEKNQLSVELHPEGNLEFKKSFEPFLDQIDQNFYTTRIWHYGLESNSKGNFHKVVSKTKCCDYNNESEPTAHQVKAVAHRLIEYYESFQYKIENYLREINFLNTSKKNKLTMKPALNQILYGPPGTGKTYKLKSQFFDRYTSKETSISKNQHIENVIRDCSWWQVIGLALLELKKAKVSDIASHPLVVIKTQLSNSNTVRPTIWGQLQSHTIEECEYVNVKSKQQPFIFNKTEDSFWELLENETKEQYPELYDISESINNFIPNPDKEIKRYVFTTFHQSYSYEDFIEGIKPIMPKEEGEVVDSVGYHIESGIFKQLCEQASRDPENHYAIFIDEINRGNVSAVFGELITLIEVDKRKNGKNPMSVTLPYSKKSFSVPSNVDIIGTMNTADRSVEALDTALRRRFTFEEMMPDPSLLKETIEGISLEKLLTTINERIESLIDRDHTIGHAYFINVNSIEDLQLNFKDKIIPLLQEYFYGDYGKIGLVLGEGFVDVDLKKDSIFSSFQYEGRESLLQTCYTLKSFKDIDFEKALNQLFNKK